MTSRELTAENVEKDCAKFPEFLTNAQDRLSSYKVSCRIVSYPYVKARRRGRNSLPDTFCKLYFRAVEKPRFVILEESLLSPSAGHAQKFKGRIKKRCFQHDNSGLLRQL